MADTRPAEDALVELLTQITTEDRNPRRPHTYRRYSISDLAGVELVDEILDRPIRHACAHAVRSIGKRLHRDGADMHAVAERVWNRAGSNKARGHWEGVLNQRWDGIGNWLA